MTLTPHERACFAAYCREQSVVYREMADTTMGVGEIGITAMKVMLKKKSDAYAFVALDLENAVPEHST
jgi:hypothetical protein